VWPNRRFRLTREGKWFIGATVVLGLAAMNGGINLLFLVFGMLLCLLLANGVLSETCLRRLVVTRRLPGSIHAGAPFLMGIAVRNTKRRIPTFSLEVEDLVNGRPVDRRCFYLKLPAGREQETAYRRTLARRGRHRLTGLRISTRFPFGLLRRSVDLDQPLDLLAYPTLVPVGEALLRSGLTDAGERPSAIRARSGDFESLREFRPGDDPRDIHWRTSARRNRPFVREFEEDTSRVAIIVLDDTPPVDGPADGIHPPFEAAVSLAASVALALLGQGYQIGLVAGSTHLPPNSGSAHATAILRALALVDMRTADAAPPAVSPGRGATILRVWQGARSPHLEAVPPARGAA
jgi:uncharacterized protein (DUF58 family)